MRTRTKAAVAATCLLLAAAAFLLPRSRPAQRPAVSSVATRGPRVDWPEAKRFTYALSWTAKTGGEVAPGQDGKTNQSLSMESTAAGEIALERAGGSRSRAQVALSWTRLDKVSFGMQGQQAAGDLSQLSAALVGQTAFLEIDDRGRIGEISFPPEMSPSIRQILRSLALELRYTLPEVEANDWDAVERDSLGELSVRYRMGQKDLAREPIAYQLLDAVSGALAGKQELRGGAVISLDAANLPVSIEEATSAVYTKPTGTAPAVQSTWTFLLHRTGEGAARAGLAAAVVRARAQPLAAQVEDPDREHRRDLRLAEGMSLDRLALTFDRFENGTKVAHDFLMKAAAWLRVHPEDLPSMTAKFMTKDLTVKGRGLILDVLAETGNPGAQQTMRDALSSDAARARPQDFSILVQRFTFVIAPERGSIDFLQRELDAAKLASNVTAAQGTAVALGSAVRRLDGQNEHALAQQVNERLRQDLRQAGSPELRGALVAALGNAGRAEDVPDLIAVAGDDDVRVRSQVASALRTVDSKEARTGLFSLAVDQSAMVASTAFGSLQKQSLEDDDWQQLAGLARDGRTPSGSDSALVELVRTKGRARTEGREILTQLLKRNTSPDSDLPAIIKHLLEEKKG